MAEMGHQQNRPAESFSCPQFEGKSGLPGRVSVAWNRRLRVCRNVAVRLTVGIGDHCCCSAPAPRARPILSAVAHVTRTLERKARQRADLALGGVTAIRA